jgi:hypothetical protein
MLRSVREFRGYSGFAKWTYLICYVHLNYSLIQGLAEIRDCGNMIFSTKTKKKKGLKILKDNNIKSLNEY